MQKDQYQCFKDYPNKFNKVYEDLLEMLRKLDCRP